MLRRILSVTSGILVFAVFVELTDMLSGKLYPPPSAIDWKDKHAVMQFVQSLPLSASVFIIAGYAVGALLGSVVGTLVSGRETIRTTVVVAVVAGFANIANAVMLGHPFWFVVLAPSVSLVAAYIGYLIARKRGSQINP